MYDIVYTGRRFEGAAPREGEQLLSIDAKAYEHNVIRHGDTRRRQLVPYFD